VKTALGAVLIIAAALYLPKCQAETSMVMTLGSRHLDGGSYCETNFGLGFEHDWWVGGFYKNSLCRTSTYTGAQKCFVDLGIVEVCGVALAITGYEDPITLGAGVVLKVAEAVNIIWFPNKKGEFQNGVIGVQLVSRFD
jgi:hypothetical protein